MKNLIVKLVLVLASCASMMTSVALAQKLELVVRTSHSERVESVAVSPNRKILASTGGNIILWDASNGRFIKQLGGDERQDFVVFSPDGKTLASCNAEQLILWNTDTGEQLKKWKGDFYGVNQIAFSPDGKLLATTGWEAITIWDTEGREIRRLVAHDNTNLSVAFSPDGKVLASSGQDKEEPVKIWEVKTWKLLTSLKGHQKAYGDLRVWSIEFSPDGKRLATNSLDNTVKLWDWESGKNLQTFRGFSELDRSLAFSPDGRVLATSGDNEIKLWDVSTGKEILTLGEKEIESPDGVEKRIPPTGEEDMDQEEADSTSVILSLKFSGDGKKLMSSSSDASTTFWDVATGNPVQTLVPKKILSLMPVKSGTTLAIEFGADIKLLDLANIQDLKTLQGKTISEVASSLDNKLLAGSADNTLKLWGLQVIQINGRMIKILTEGSTIKLSNYADNKEIAKVVLLDENDWAVLAPDGRFDASEGAQNFMHYTYGLEVINLEQLKEMYYEPGLLQKLLGYSQEPLRPIVPLKEIKLYPEIVEPQVEQSTGKLTIKLKDRGGGIGKTEVYINGKMVVADARDERLKAGPTAPPDEVVTLTVNLRASSFVKGKENRIKVVTSNYLKEIGKGNIRSRGAELVWKPEGAEEYSLPTLYAIVGGVSDYAGEQLDLRFAAKDAEDFSHALQLGARRLFCLKENPNCLDKVQITTLSSSRQKREEQPTKENFQKAFAAIAAKARPEDILVIYLAGHGVSFGTGTDTYFYLTQEARTANREDLAKVLSTSTISSEELTEWLTIKEWTKGQKGVRALKQVLILDTCASGNAAEKLALSAKRELSGDQIRAIEFLKDKTGTFVLMASTADAPSYEANQFGQGLLTYSLLQAMKGAALDKGEYVDVQMLFSYAQAQVPRLATNIGGIQRPIVSAPLGKTFVIGQMTDADKNRLSLPMPKPLLLRPLLTNPETGDDDLKLIPELRKRLDAESSYEVMRRSGKGDPVLIYIDDDSFPGAVRVTGTYTVEGDNVRIKAFLRRDGKTIATLPEIFTVQGKVSDALMTAARGELSKWEVR